MTAKTRRKELYWLNQEEIRIGASKETKTDWAQCPVCGKRTIKPGNVCHNCGTRLKKKTV